MSIAAFNFGFSMSILILDVYAQLKDIFDYKVDYKDEVR